MISEGVRVQAQTSSTLEFERQPRDGSRNLETVMRNLVYLNIYDEGQACTEREHRDWLTEAGFADFERKILPDGFSLVRARKT